MDFYIMNKDIEVAIFRCSYTCNIEQINITYIIRQDLLPKGLVNGMSLTEWINSRLAISNRLDIMTLFRSIGLKNKADILIVTKGVSLNDTYWIKEVTNKSLKWKNVSPYINPLNRNMSDYSFEISKIIKNIGMSPDFATSGNFPKCWKRINGHMYLIKGGSRLFSNAGNEIYSELLSSELLTKLRINHVKYDYIKYKGYDATKCLNMCTEDIGIYPLHHVNTRVNNFVDLLEYYKYDKNILDMLLFDYLSLNTDRHWGNISVFVNNNNQQILGFTPIYDNNLAFVPYYTGSERLEDYICNSEGSLVASDGMSFDDLFKLIDCKYVREKIELIKGIKLTYKCKRTDIANEVLDMQLKKIKRT